MRFRSIRRGPLAVAILLAGLLAASSGVVRAATPTAHYELTFEATWSEATHPDNFPPNPHFSGLIGGTHNDQVIFWSSGTLASPGLKSVAETGSTSEAMPIDEPPELPSVDDAGHAPARSAAAELRDEIPSATGVGSVSPPVA